MEQEGWQLVVVVLSVFMSRHMCEGMTYCSSVGSSFNNNLYGWTSSSNNKLSFDPPVWQAVSGSARLNVKDKVGANVDLISPWLDSQAGHTCQLTFRYSLGGLSGTSGCKLTVEQTTDSGAPYQLWSTGTSQTSSSYVSVPVDCQSGSRYQIIIKGEAVVRNTCGLENVIVVDDITCTDTPPPTTTKPTTTRTTTTKPTTTTTRTTTGTTTTTTTTPTTAGETARPTCDNCSTDTSSSASQEPTPAGISAGAVAGLIAIFAIIIIVVAAAGGIYRRRQKRNLSSSWSLFAQTGSSEAPSNVAVLHIQGRSPKISSFLGVSASKVSALRFWKRDDNNSPREFALDQATRDRSGALGHPNNDLHGSGYPGNDNEGSAGAHYEDVERLGVSGGATAVFVVQTYQTASNNIYEPLDHEDVGLSNPYNVLTNESAPNTYEQFSSRADIHVYKTLTNESAPNTYEAFSSRADSHVYKTLTNQKRDADGYEWPVARAKPRP